MKSTSINVVDCGEPHTIPNGAYKVLVKVDVVTEDMKSHVLRQQVNYSCNTGFVNAFTMETTLNCNGSSGNFQPELPQCLTSKYIRVQFFPKVCAQKIIVTKKYVLLTIFV